ncbi:hypothetical protein BBPC_0745 [Bifidobacterium pseudocatenulatum DSM 20438 = JCM 1200 = LMG 10505]|nr:hypothetical protein BBPC_0745 [Bifidobacterium pseudocatenulatum DSM 20438 = JCM 1200 = LMG 10505]
MPITNEVNNARRFCKGAYRIGERTVTFLVAVILPRENRLSDRATVPSACEPALHRHTVKRLCGRLGKQCPASFA